MTIYYNAYIGDYLNFIKIRSQIVRTQTIKLVRKELFEFENKPINYEYHLIIIMIIIIIIIIITEDTAALFDICCTLLCFTFVKTSQCPSCTTEA